jgi:DNA-binding response OmpR family regulator
VTWRPASAEDEPLAGLNILVVDDEPVIALEVECILRDAGAEVVGPAFTLEDGLKLARRPPRPISMAVLDVRLGGRSVSPVAQVLAERGTPILFYTGQLASDPALSAWDSTAVMTKPCPARAMVTRLRRLWDRSHPDAGGAHLS